MILKQTDLIEASYRFDAITFEKRYSSKTNNNPLYILHTAQDIRLVEGLIITLRESVGSLSFRWESGYDLDAIQIDQRFDTKEMITSSSAIIFLATYKSLQDSNLLNLLEFSNSIGKKTYVFPTSYNSVEYGTSLSSKYCMMYIERLRGINKTNLKVKFPDSKNLMHTILSEEQLR